VSAKYSKQKGCAQNIAKTGVMGAANGFGPYLGSILSITVWV
jgi:hypothetical protein